MTVLFESGYNSYRFGGINDSGNIQFLKLVKETAENLDRNGLRADYGLNYRINTSRPDSNGNTGQLQWAFIYGDNRIPVVLISTSNIDRTNCIEDDFFYFHRDLCVLNYLTAPCGPGFCILPQMSPSDITSLINSLRGAATIGEFANLLSNAGGRYGGPFIGGDQKYKGKTRHGYYTTLVIPTFAHPLGSTAGKFGMFSNGYDYKQKILYEKIPIGARGEYAVDVIITDHGYAIYIATHKPDVPNYGVRYCLINQLNPDGTSLCFATVHQSYNPIQFTSGLPGFPSRQMLCAAHDGGMCEACLYAPTDFAVIKEGLNRNGAFTKDSSPFVHFAPTTVIYDAGNDGFKSMRVDKELFCYALRLYENDTCERMFWTTQKQHLQGDTSYPWQRQGGLVISGAAVG